MSTTSTAHDIVAYDPKASKAFTGQRLAKVTYKTNSETGIKPPSVCVSVPVATVDQEFIAQAMPYLIDWYQTQQDAIIRTIHEEGSKIVTDTDIAGSAVLAYLVAQAQGNRLTKEFLLDWFAAELADNLTLAISDKLQISDTPTDAQTKQVNQMISGYRDSLCAMAGGKTAFTPQKAEKLIKALSLANDPANATTARLMAKLESMKKVEELVDLGL